MNLRQYAAPPISGPRWRILGLLGLALLVLVMGAWPVHAQGGDSGVVFTDHYTLAEGEQVTGDLVVVAQTITLQHGSTVTGSVALLGEAITLDGHVMGDLAAMGENVMLGTGAYVTGSATLCGTTIRREPNVQIMGDYSASCDRVDQLLGEVVPLAIDPSHWNWEDFDPAALDLGLLDEVGAQVAARTPLEHLGQNALRSLVMGALAAFFTLVGPLRLRRMSDAALITPVTMGLIGLLTLVVAGALTALVIFSVAVILVTICLLPFVGLAWVALVLMILMGWSALSLPVGAWLLAQMNIRRVSPLAAAAVGAVTLTFLTGLLTLTLPTTIVFVGVILLLASWGLGAVIMTRLGGQTFHRTRAPVRSVSRQA